MVLSEFWKYEKYARKFSVYNPRKGPNYANKTHMQTSVKFCDDN